MTWERRLKSDLSGEREDLNLSQDRRKDVVRTICSSIMDRHVNSSRHYTNLTAIDCKQKFSIIHHSICKALNNGLVGIAQCRESHNSLLALTACC